MFARFGQELYATETIAAAAIIAGHYEDSDRCALRARIAELLPHTSASTRMRVATKLLQRLAAGAPPGAQPQVTVAAPITAAQNGPGEADSAASEARLPATVASFARLLSNLPDTQARRDLVYYATARTDTLVGAIAHDILYPYFIEGCIPPPYTEDEFIMANAGLLLAPEPILTTGFVADFARRTWGFDSERTICLAMRILRQAGILLSAPLLGARGRVAAYTLAPHGLSLPALLWGLYDEFGRDNMAPAWDQVGCSHCARLFVVPASVITSRLWEAERVGLVGFWSAAGSRRVALKVREPQALARLLLSGPENK